MRFREDWLTHMVKEVRTNRDYTDRTIQTARWAREQIKRQTGRFDPISSHSQPSPFALPNGLPNGITRPANVRAHDLHAANADVQAQPWFPSVVENGFGSEDSMDERWEDDLYS